MTKESAYYGNQECEIIADLGDEVVIEIVNGEMYYQDEYEAYSEPTYVKIVVDKKMITSSKLDPKGMAKEYSEMISKAKLEIAKFKDEHRNNLYEERRKLQDDIKKLEKKALKYQGLKEYVEYLSDEIKYIVYLDSYKHSIQKFSMAMCHYNDSELASVSFRNNKYGKDKLTAMYLSEYSDESGINYEIKGFKTLDEAKQFYLELVEDKMNSRRLRECKIWSITSPKIKKYEEVLKANEQAEKEKEKQKLIKKLENLDKE